MNTQKKRPSYEERLRRSLTELEAWSRGEGEARVTRIDDKTGEVLFCGIQTGPSVVHSDNSELRPSLTADPGIPNGRIGGTGETEPGEVASTSDEIEADVEQRL